MSPEQIDAFLAQPLIAHLTTLRRDGSPRTTPVWYQYRDGRFYVFTVHTTRKLPHLRRDPRVSISVASQDEPYRYVTATGTATVREADVMEEAIAIASRYRGADSGPSYIRGLAARGAVVLITIMPSRLVSWVADS
jgi:PPOX class probable F420-dependent enzyme